jgi:microcompartment protein CcmK/EutM
MTGVEFERPLAVGLDAVGGGRPFWTGRFVDSGTEARSLAEMPSASGFVTCSSIKGGMSSTVLFTARSGSDSGDEIRSCIWAADSLSVGDGKNSFPLLALVSSIRAATVVGVIAGLAVLSDRPLRPGLVESRSAVYELVPCSVIGDRAGVGSWSCVAVAMASLPSSVLSFIVRL